MKFYDLEKRSPIPLYVQLADIIKRNIREGILKENDLIPSEARLMEKYKISRITVRNALLRLEHDRDIFKVHGRGSFVAAKENIIITSPFYFFKSQMSKLGIDITEELIEFENVYPTERVRSELNLKPDELVTKVKRIMKMGNESIGLRSFFVPHKFGNKMRYDDVENRSMLDYLNENPATKIAKMEVKVQAAVIADGDAEVMGVDNNSTVLVRGVIFWTRLGVPIMSGRVLYLAQHAMFKMHLNIETIPMDVSVEERPLVIPAEHDQLDILK